MDQNPEMQGNNPPEPDLQNGALAAPESVDAAPNIPAPEDANIAVSPDPVLSPESYNTVASPEIIPASNEVYTVAPENNHTVDSNAQVPAVSPEVANPQDPTAIVDTNGQSAPAAALQPESTDAAPNSDPAKAPAALVAQPAKPKHHHKSKSKKRHKGNPPVVYVRRPALLIAIMILLTLFLIAGAGLASWYLFCYNRPEKIAFDAISNFLNEHSVLVDGIIKTESRDASIMLTLESSNVDFSGSSKMTLTMSPLDANGSVIYEQPYQVEIGSIFMSDGVLYVRVDELIDAVDQYLEDHVMSIDDLGSTALFGYELADMIDGEWWQISIPDLIDMYADSPYSAKPAKELYACMINVANRDIKQELASIYSDHQFINVEKVKHPAAYSENVSNGFNSIYHVSFNYDQMAEFINDLPDTETAQGAYNCVNRYFDSTDLDWQIAATDFDEVTSEQLSNSFSSIEKLEFEITNFGHQLVGVSASDEHSTVGLSFQYQPATIAPPNRYHRFTELIEELTTAMLESYGIYNNIEYNPITKEWEIIEDELTIDEIETT